MSDLTDMMPVLPPEVVMVTVKKSYLDALIAVAQSAQEHEDVKSMFWPKEKAMLFALKSLKDIQP